MADKTGLLDPLFGTSAMDAVWSDRSRLQGMLDFEAALAKAEADIGIVPASCVSPIRQACVAALFDPASLGLAAAGAGNTAIPLVKSLTAEVAKTSADAARFVHWGATSQDAMDSGLVLQIRDALRLLDSDLQRLETALIRLAADHVLTIMPGRTWLQQALPITFGLKAASWLSAVRRGQERLSAASESIRILQFGGAAGTLASLGTNGLAVAKRLAAELDLALPDLPWHAQRDRLADLAAALGILCGTLGKIARDISLMMQTEIGEAFEPAGAGKGGSSTMPHKRNPVACAVVLSTALRAPQLVATMLAALPQDHERGLGGWHAEWETLPELFRLTAGALDRMVDVAEGLEIDAVRMADNLKVTHGAMLAEAVSMALAEKIGKTEAHETIEAACRRVFAEARPLRAILAETETVTQVLSAHDLDRLLDPANYLGETEAFVARVLAGIA